MAETICYHSIVFGQDILCYQKKYADKIVSYCLNNFPARWMEDDNLIAIFKTKKLKNDR